MKSRKVSFLQIQNGPQRASQKSKAVCGKKATKRSKSWLYIFFFLFFFFSEKKRRGLKMKSDQNKQFVVSFFKQLLFLFHSLSTLSLSLFFVSQSIFWNLKKVNFASDFCLHLSRNWVKPLKTSTAHSIHRPTAFSLSLNLS